MSDRKDIEFAPDLLSHLTQQSKVHLNAGQNIIVTTEDKLRLCLNHHVDAISRKNAWITPLTLSITIATVLSTSDFRDFVIPKETWQAAFVIVGLGSAVWLAKTVIGAFRVSTSIDSIIQTLKPPPQRTAGGSSTDRRIPLTDLLKNIEPFN